ncbi:MAG TPA: hypothetical protein VHE35_07790 [Kofleriaceae bacterium]|nr:hypothetical protein [Kofleriaceae bacterium]
MSQHPPPKLLDAIADGDGEATVRVAALHYVDVDDAGLTRVRRGRSFGYRTHDGRPVRDRRTIARIRALAIPPAWTNVWIASDADAHVQATGRDARGRKQYRYHPRWRKVRDEAKFHRLVAFCRALPAIRRAVAHDLSCACLCKRKVVATVIALLERAQLRVGNEEYARTNGSYGATTLRDRHARFRGATLELAYRAKSGVEQRVTISDAKLTRIVRRCRDLPGQRLFQYVDDDGRPAPITSSDVNDYLREVSGGPFTAKDFRTWAATIAAAAILCALERPADARGCKRCVKEMLESVAERLGHTPAVCRGSYVHPAVIDGFVAGRLAGPMVTRVKRLLRGRRWSGRPLDARKLGIDALRALEPAVARYLAAR